VGTVLGVPDVTPAQEVSFDVSFDQSFTSLEPVPSPTGFAVSAGLLRLWGPLGLEAGFRNAWDPGGTVDQRCGLDGCTTGPYEQTYTTRTAGLGLTYDVSPDSDVRLTLAAGATANWLARTDRHVSTGESATVDPTGSDLGLGASARIRLRPLWRGLRPGLSFHYERVLASDCVPDAPCWPGRSVLGFSVGFGWIFQPPSEG